MNSEEKSKEPIVINGEPVETEEEVDPVRMVGCLVVILVVVGIWAGFATGVAYMALR